jgi:excisionase family DNA binding protein
MTTQTLIGVSEAADRLNVSARTVMRWALSGELAYVTKLPGTTGAYVFELATVEALRISRGGAA